MRAIRAEAEAVYRAAGIEWIELRRDEPRRKGVSEVVEVPGVERAGGSSLQSLKRHAGSIETGYLNGEIVLLGRLHGVATPLNEALCELGEELTREGIEPGSLTPDALRGRLALGG